MALTIDDPTSAQANGQTVARAFGAILLIVGIVISAWVLISAIGLLRGTETLPLVQQMTTAADPHSRTLVTPAGAFELPLGFFLGTAYGVVLLLFAVVAGIGKSFLRVGASLLQPDLEQLLIKLRQQVSSSPLQPQK